MKFSIRDMFLVTFAVALALLVWRSSAALSQLQVKVAESKHLLAAEKANLDLVISQQQYHQASADRYSLIQSTAEQAEAGFRKIQERHSEILSIDEHTVSLRSVPMLIEPLTGIRANRTRIYVPSLRDVYLILGVVSKDGFQGSDAPDIQPRYIDSISVTNGGPFQLVLNPGLHDLDWVISPKKEGHAMTFKVFVDNQLQSTSSWSPDSFSGSVMHSSSNDQRNFSLTEPLPILVQAFVPADLVAEPVEQDAFQFYLQLTLSDKPNSYPAFPQIQVREVTP